MQKRGKYYWRQFFSYILIMLIPVCMGIFFYFYAYRIIKSQTDISNQNFLQNISKTCDRELQYSKNYMTQLFYNNRLGEISSENEWLRKKRDWNISYLCKDLKKIYMAANESGNSCKNIFAYFKDQDIMASNGGIMNLDFYIQYYCTEEAEEAQMLKECLLSEKPGKIISTDTKWSSDFSSLLILQPSGNPMVVLGFWLDVDSLEERVTSGAWNESLEWAAVDSQDKIILSSRNLKGLSLSYEDLREDESWKLKWNKEYYIVSAARSETYDLKYVIMMPESLITGITNRIRNFFVVAHILCLLTVIPLLGYLMRLNYNPLQKLLNLFSLSEGGGKKNDSAENRWENEYLYLEEKVRGLFEERSKFRKELDYMDQVVKEYHFVNILKTPFDMLEDTQELNNIRRQFQNRNNVVLLLKMEKYQGDNDREVISTNSLRRFIVRNVFEEGIRENYFQRTVSLGDKVAMVVQLDEAKDAEAVLRETVEQYQVFISRHFQFEVRVVSGGIHQGCEGIHLSYEEACRAEEFLKWEDVDYISYQDVGEETENFYDYSLEMEENIIKALLSKNTAAAVSMIEKVFEANAVLNKNMPDLMSCLLYDMCATVRRAAQRMEKGRKEIAELNLISAKNTMESNLDILKKVVHDLTEEPEETEENDQSRKLCKEVLSYVQEHYRDPDLNVAQTGIHFHMTSTYLSAMMKKQTGRSLLKIINETRIEEAKNLLSRGFSVQETGRQTGFRDSSTFIRLFKQMVGVTPGQFREIDKIKGVDKK